MFASCRKNDFHGTAKTSVWAELDTQMSVSAIRSMRSFVGASAFHFKDLAGRRSLDSFFHRHPAPINHGAQSIVVCEGMWDNPNHWFRLWMYLHALLSDRQLDVVAVLRSKGARKERATLQAIGIRRFRYLDDAEDCDAVVRSRAESLLRNVTSAQDMLELSLPNEYPAYAYYDTVVKLEKHPQPAISQNPNWLSTLLDVFRLTQFYAELFDGNDVSCVVSSHPWKNEYALLCWTALKRGIPFSYVTAHYNSIRIRRMSSPDDYKAPNEHLTFEEYTALVPEVRMRLIERGRKYLEEHFNGGSDFVVNRYAINPELRNHSRTDLLLQLGLDPDKPLAVVYAHSWFDFPHAQDMRNFTDPLDWIQLTIETIAEVTDINWILKPHPCDQWYGVLGIRDLIRKLPADHLAILPEPCDSLAVQNAADVLVTIHGSVGIEASAYGKPVLCADRSYYTNWGFTHTARSRQDYVEKLRSISRLAKPTRDQSERAMAYGATALGPPPAGTEYLETPCDSLYLEGTLYRQLEDLCLNRMNSVRREIDSLRKWIESSADSYNVWRTIQHYSSCDA